MADRLPRNTRAGNETKKHREETELTDSRYTPDVAADILRRVSEGEPLRQVSREIGVPESTVRGWSRDDRDGFAAKYELARRMQVGRSRLGLMRSCCWLIARI